MDTQTEKVIKESNPIPMHGIYNKANFTPGQVLTHKLGYTPLCQIHAVPSKSCQWIYWLNVTILPLLLISPCFAMGWKTPEITRFHGGSATCT